MTGNVTEDDIEVALEQMEAMKLKLVLLHDSNEMSLTYFDMTKFKAPILRFYSDKKRSDYVRKVSY